MKKHLTLKNILITLLGVLIFIQIFSIDKSLPPTVESEDFFSDASVPDDVKLLVKRACADCHSHNTKYPWYSNIEPVSWWLQGHIEHGRQTLNFSKWNAYEEERRSHKIEECIEVLENRWMPMSSYVKMHPEAKLSDEENNRLIAYFQSLR